MLQVQKQYSNRAMSIPKTHPDYIPLSVFNTILGAILVQLIKNIREDKVIPIGD